MSQSHKLTKLVIIMEKRTPHCKLAVLQALARSGRIRATASAYAGAASLGCVGLQAMREVVLGLTPSDFRKSMTTHADHRIWQDVYAPHLPHGVAVYLKLTVIDEVLIVSFKER